MSASPGANEPPRSFFSIFQLNVQRQHEKDIRHIQMFRFNSFDVTNALDSQIGFVHNPAMRWSFRLLLLLLLLFFLLAFLCYRLDGYRLPLERDDEAVDQHRQRQRLGQHEGLQHLGRRRRAAEAQLLQRQVDATLIQLQHNTRGRGW